MKGGYTIYIGKQGTEFDVTLFLKVSDLEVKLGLFTGKIVFSLAFREVEHVYIVRK